MERKYGRIDRDQLKRLKKPVKKSRRLEELTTEQALDINILM